MPEPTPVFTVDDWSLRRLGLDDEGLVQDLSERCADYTELAEGEAVGPTAGRELLASAPEGWDPARLFKLGLCDDDGVLMGLLDVAPGYPADDVWYLGLFLLDPSVRCAGLGTRLYHAFEQWAAGQGARRVMLLVVEENLAGRRFWERLGFTDVRVLPAKQMGRKLQRRWEMEREIPAP